MRIALYSKTTQRLVDTSIVAVAWVISYLIRYGSLSPEPSRQLLTLLVPVAMGQIGLSTLLGVYRLQWRYVSADDALYIGRAYFYFSIVLLAVRLGLGPFALLLNVPVGVIASTSVLAYGGAMAARLTRRTIYRRSSGAVPEGATRRFLLVGAGAHGAMVAREMLVRHGIEVVGFVDDDTHKKGAMIAGIPVLGSTAQLPEIVRSREVDEVLVCISPKSRGSLRLDAGVRNGLHVRSRVIPTLEEVLGASTSVPVLPSLIQPPRTSVNAPPGTDGGGPAVEVRALVPTPVEHGDSGDGNGVKLSTGRQAPRLTSVPTPHIVENRTILITGGAGFIGSSLADKLAARNRVILLDLSFENSPLQFTSLLRHPNVSTVTGSVLDVDLRSVLKEADVVVHAAAILGVNRVCNSGRVTLETNYVGTSRLLRALDCNPSLQRFVYFSSSEVFGVNSYRVDETSRPSVGPIAESRWSYAMSKLAGEHLVASYFRETRMPTTIVRPFNIFGPRRTGDYALRRFILAALQGKPLEVHGDGTQIRSWCYIEDFCSALLRMIALPEAIGEDFNIGHPGNTLTVYELAQKVIQLSRSDSAVIFVDSPFPDISIRVPALDKARRLLAFEPRFDLNTALQLTIDWHREYLDVLAPAPQLATEAAGTRAAA